MTSIISFTEVLNNNSSKTISEPDILFESSELINFSTLFKFFFNHFY